MRRRPKPAPSSVTEREVIHAFVDSLSPISRRELESRLNAVQIVCIVRVLVRCAEGDSLIDRVVELIELAERVA